VVLLLNSFATCVWMLVSYACSPFLQGLNLSLSLYRYFVDSGILRLAEGTTCVCSISMKPGIASDQQKCKETLFPKSTNYRYVELWCILSMKLRERELPPSRQWGKQRVSYPPYVAPAILREETIDEGHEEQCSCN